MNSERIVTENIIDENLISVIVPVYNAENYLCRCIDSLLAQTYYRIEVILVDDGSTDTSLQICKNYEKNDSRIRVIHQENQGVSAARNTGIDEAKGQYIGFVDSDDAVVPEMYECMLNLAHKYNAAVVMCDAMSVYSDGRIIEDDTISTISNSTILHRDDLTCNLLKEMAGSVWRCIYRKDCLVNDNNKIRFIRRMKFSEDRIFNLNVFSRVDCIYYEKKALYKRYILAESTVNRYHKDYYNSVQFAYKETISVLNKYWGADYFSLAEDQFVYCIVGAIKNVVRRESQLSISEKMKELRKMCQNDVLVELLPNSNIEIIIKYWILHKWYFCLLHIDTRLNKILRIGTRQWMKLTNQ